ncbi:MAG: GGDEF domain-containing protein [Gammaproteobacteria bacterium]|nr:GGDEF domain-containing protein [Gammaproteobacteria bacterium]NNC77874.1 GGDEF domain-containing protein [Woeseiaceae bacterium]
MKAINRKILEQVIDATSEPLMIIRLDDNDWPVVLANAACKEIACDDVLRQPFADVLEARVGRDLALEISESFRARQETSFPVEIGTDEYLLTLKPMTLPNEDSARFYAAIWRGGTGAAGRDAQHALIRAKSRIRDLTRDDPVTGLLNAKAFREVLDHDWAVAAREKSTLALVIFTLDDFDAYIEVFGRHASDSCVRRVGQTIRRCLRRASDVVAAMDSSRLVVLSHASNESGVREFANSISGAVRDLGLHHPRSSKGRFVTVTSRVSVTTAGEQYGNSTAFLGSVTEAESGDD